MDVNKCIFSGRLCEDPEVKDIGDGKKLARFRLAVECYKKEDKKVNFLKFVTWNCANFAEKNLKRGMKVLVESTCNSGSYLNGSGSKVYTTEFNASLITVLDWRNPSNEQNEATHNYFADIDYIVATGGTYDAWSEQFNNVFRYMDGLQIIPGNINDPDLSNIYSNVRGYYYQRVNQIR